MAFSSVSIADVKALRRHFDVKLDGVKLNDIALALCAGALRSYLIDRDELPTRPLSVGVPVSTRTGGDTSLGNELSYLAVPLPTNLEDPEERLRAIVHETQAAKGVHEAMRASPLGSVADTAPPFMIAALLRLAYQSHVLGYIPGMMNTIVSNVPGPPMDLYSGNTVRTPQLERHGERGNPHSRARVVAVRPELGQEHDCEGA